ncbi:MAG: M48 family metalloprotease, partial [bacterium]
MHQKRPILLVFAALLAIGTAPVQGAPGDDYEIRLGRDYARRIELQYKVVTDAAMADRVARIGHLIAETSERPTLPWSFKVIEFTEPNAVALPGGFVYITKPMLAFARSDHELAAVLAHEVAHTARRHQMEMIRRSNQAAFWTLIIVALTGDPNLAAGAQLISYGMLSGYTRELEREADLLSIAYLARTSYTPVAALTLMERLLRDERLRATVDPGAFREHPRTEERVAYIQTELRR